MSNSCSIVRAQPSSRQKPPRNTLKGGEGDRVAAAAAHWSGSGNSLAAGNVRERSGQFDRLALLACVSVLALLATDSAAGARQLGGAVSATTATSQAAQSVSQQAAAIAKQSQSSMLRAVQALQAVQAAQAAARQVAVSGSSSLKPGLPAVTDGLSPGGLVVDPRVGANPNLWINADQPTSSTTSNGQTSVVIRQTAQNAVMTWQQFNVGRNTTLSYDQQGNANWVALNRIDATGVPSQILGRIKADGTVLIINPNGIIFGGSSQIDVHTLIATSLDINSGKAASVFYNGSTYSPTYVAQTANGMSFFVPVNEVGANQAFAQNGLFPLVGTAATSFSAIFSLGSQTLGSFGGGAIEVQPGASIATSTTATGDGGYVALLGPKVTNAGSITTQNGQIILAAGSTIVLSEPVSSATGVQTALTVTQVAPVTTNSGSVTVSTKAGTDTFSDFMGNNPSLAGGGLVTNAASGLLMSKDGAVTLVGDSVAQLGGIAVTTSVTRPGSILLSTAANSTGAGAVPTNGSGNIILGPGSLTSILPDEGGGAVPTGVATASYFQSFLQPQIQILASGSVDVQAGAFIKAPSAAVMVNAGPAGTVLLETGSTVDLSGLIATASVSDAILSILITPAEVADTPLVRNLIGQTVLVDTRLSGTRDDGIKWVGSPLLNVSGFSNLVPKTIDQVLTGGGSFKVNAVADGNGNLQGVQNVIQQPGSVVNVSGGFVAYAGGLVKTTRLLGADGRFYDIGSANPNQGYVVAGGFTVAHPHWNITEIYASPLSSAGHFEPDSISGASAGSVNVMAVSPILAGAFVGDIVAGTRQRAGIETMPAGAALSVSFTASAATAITTPTYNVVLEPTADAIPNAGVDPFGLSSFRFGANWTPTLVNSLFPIFSDTLSATGLGSISINTGLSTLSMPSDVTLTVRPGGKVTLGNVTTIDGTINARSGSITLTGAGGVNLYNDVEVGPHAVLNVAGLWVNDAGLTGGDIQGSAFVDGGSVTITTTAANVVTRTGIVSGTVGTVTLNSNYQQVVVTDVTRSIVLSAGSVIDVSSGGYVGSNGRLGTTKDGLPTGRGGSLTLQTYVGGMTALAGTSGIGVGVVADNSVVTLDNGKTIPAGTQIYYFDKNQPDFVGLQAFAPTDGVLRANVVMNGSVRAHGFAGGGTLSLQAPKVTIDGAATQIASSRSGSARSGELVLPASFFTDNAFSQYVLTSAVGNLTVTAGSTINLRQLNYLAPAAAASIPTGASVGAFAAIGLAADAVRKPVSLTLQQSGTASTGLGILVDTGATVNAEAGASVSLIATGGVTMLGNIVTGASSTSTVNLVGSAVNVQGGITAHGGTINIVGVGVSNPSPTAAAQDVWLGSNAMLDVSGEFVPSPLVTGYTTGSALDGGTITLDSSTVVVQAGAQLLLKGTAAIIQVPQRAGSLVAQSVWSNGGTLQLAGSAIYLAGTIKAQGGAPLASGGTLTIGNVAVPSAVKSYATGTDTVTGNLDGPGNFVFVQSGNVAANFTAMPKTVSDLTAMKPAASGLVSADTLNNSGFDSVSVAVGRTDSTAGATAGIGFSGSVNLTLRGALTLNSANGNFTVLKAGVIDLTNAGSTNNAVVNLNAGYIRLVGRNTANASTPAAPNSNDGTLNLNAQWIDLQREIAFVNIGDHGSEPGAKLISADAIRLLPELYGYPLNTTIPQSALTTVFGGYLITPSSLTLKAAEIYPVSDTGFLIQAQGNSTLKILPNGIAKAPLSAGGTLVLDATTISQGGTLWAPLGNIVIGLNDASQLPSLLVQSISAKSTTYNGTVVPTDKVTLEPGSVTSVSAAGLDIPYGYTIDGAGWYLGTASASTTPASLAAAPAKSIGLFGAKVTTNTGAVIDASGGGDIYATEYIAGNGGSRNVLTTAADRNGNAVAVYALVPSANANVAAYDQQFAMDPYNSASNPVVGTSITIAGGNGIPAGTYVLMPGMYATVPGAYRVVTVNSYVNSTVPVNVTTADGSQYVTGTVINALTGARQSQTSLFRIQSAAVWKQSSRIDITSGTSFFRNQAIASGNALPPSPIDGGTLSIAATSTLTLLSTNRFASGLSDMAAGLQGSDGKVAISASNILVKASDQTEPAADCHSGPGCTGAVDYLVLDADQISHLGVRSVIIGGSIASISTGDLLTATAQNLEIETDAAHPLTGPELILVSKAATGAKGITVDSGSVIGAVGTAASASRTITIGTSTVSGDGSLLRVANGGVVKISRTNLTTTLGQIAIGTTAGTATINASGAAVTINGGNALTIDSSGGGALAANASLIARNYDLSGSVINIGGGSTGLVLTQANLASFAGAQEVQLRSASVINLYDANGLTVGDTLNPIVKLTLDGSQLFSQGGTTTINALNLVITNSQATPNLANTIAVAQLTSTKGTLNVNAGVNSGKVFGTDGSITHDKGAVALGNIQQARLAASGSITYKGTGSLDAGGAKITMSAPTLLVSAGASQTLKNVADVNIQLGAGKAPAPVATNFGGALTIAAGSIEVSAPIQALSGKVTLEATTGDVTLNAGGAVVATGSTFQIQSQTEYAPGGSVSLISDNGNVTINAGAMVDVSGSGWGYAGSLTITTGNSGATGTATLNGTLLGHAGYNDMGGNFTLNAGALAGTLPFDTAPGVANFSRSFSATLAQGDIAVGSGQSLTSGDVVLTANHGGIRVDGTIDASGPSGGIISLYGSGTSTNAAGTAGASGVTIGAGARLYARYQADDPNDPLFANGTSTLVQRGGTIALGTTGTPDGTTNTTYGYENVTGSGAITVAPGAIFDVSGGSGGTEIDNTGGSVIIRAPILTNNNVNVSFKGTVVTNADASGKASGGGVALDAYAVWSTTDDTTGSKHFDGIIDPAGWFDGTGKMVDGSWFIPQRKLTGLTVTNGGTYAMNAAVTVTLGAATAADVVSSSTTTVTKSTGLSMGVAGGTSNGQAGSVASNVYNVITVAAATGGSGYTTPPTVTFNTPTGGTAAKGTAVINSSGTVTAVIITDPGSGYDNATGKIPTITFSGATGVGGTAAKNLAAAAVTGFTTSANIVLQVRSVAVPTATQTLLTGLAPNILFVTTGNSSVTATFTPITQAAPASLIATETGGVRVAATGVTSSLTGYFVPGAANSDHTGFYQTTLVGFVQKPFNGNAAAVAGDFTGAKLQIGASGTPTQLSTSSMLHLRPEVVLVNPSSSKNNGNISVLSNWNLGGTTSPGSSATAATYTPSYRTTGSIDPGEAGVLTLRAVNNIAINATISDGFFETSDVFGASTIVANQIANNPNGSDVNTTAAAALMSVVTGINNGSFTYDFIAGAANSVNPDAIVASVKAFPTITSGVDPTTNGQISSSITINGHTNYLDALATVTAPASATNNKYLMINIPTLVRTGTGSIRMTAGGYVAFLDSVTPGAVYTAGAVMATPAGFTAPALTPGYLANANGLVSTPTWAAGGGSVTIAARQSIIGIETPIDTTGLQTGVTNGPTGQLWSDWYEHYGLSNGTAIPFAACAAAGSVACQTASWVNYATFFQGFGALGGGNITLTAGGDITDVAASLPETILVSGGLSAGAANAPVLHTYGGGNLLVQAGGDLNSGNFLVGKGSGLILVGGAVQADTKNPVTGVATLGRTVANATVSATTYELPLLLAVQDGFINVNAQGSVKLGNVFDPAMLPLDAMIQTSVSLYPSDPNNYLPGSAGSTNKILGNDFTSFSARSGIALTSTRADVNAFTVKVGSSSVGLFVHNTRPSAVGNYGGSSALLVFSLPARLDVSALTGSITIDTGNNDTLMPFPTATGNDTGTFNIVAAQSINLTSLAMPELTTTASQYIGGGVGTLLNYISPLGIPLNTVALALHANDPQPVVFAAGQDISVPTTGSIKLIKPALIEAGRDIAIAKFIGQNNNATDITAIIAGRDIVSVPDTNNVATAQYYLYGPGDWLLQAGRNIGPFRPSTSNSSDQVIYGVMAVGDGSNYQKGALANADVTVRSYLPRQSANITVLFGVGPGVDYADFIDGYINPANAAAHGVTEPYVVTGAGGQSFDLSTVTGWAMFQRQSTARQHLIADRFFLDFLTRVAKDYNDPNSSFAGQYARAYQAISTLFPASLGYTNNATGTGNGAAAPIQTGRLNLAYSVLETQMGGDINIIGPGGGVTVGSNSAQLPKGSTSALLPNQQGVLTLAGGSIRAFTDGSIMVNQSRIMTEQGGDIDLFSANGDIGAGSGPKTYISSPVFSPICDANGFCRVNPSGLVTGAGIAALVTLPGQDPTESDVNLATPHGKLDFGSAGVRVGGNLNILALQVVNGYNVQVAGVSVGIPTAPAANTALSVPANNPAPANVAQPTGVESTKQTSVIIVEVLGFGGSGTDAPADNSNVNSGGAGAPKHKGNDKCTSGEECQP